MKIKVLKFGGTSVGSVEAIKRSANIICDWSKKSKVIVVLSAMSGAVSYTHLTLPTIDPV